MNLKKVREPIEKKRVLLITEGTYPYNYGGVSSWSHTLCNLTKNVEFLNNILIDRLGVARVSIAATTTVGEIYNIT